MTQNLPAYEQTQLAQANQAQGPSAFVDDMALRRAGNPVASYLYEQTLYEQAAMSEVKLARDLPIPDHTLVPDEYSGWDDNWRLVPTGGPQSRNGTRPPIELARNDRTDAIFQTFAEAGEAIGTVPAAYRDIQAIGAKLPEVKILLEVEKMKVSLEKLGYGVPTPQDFGLRPGMVPGGPFGTYSKFDSQNAPTAPRIQRLSR